ncbi:MAG: Crp/Fnr family transcriptional regulator [Candidatus Daviesbacteria bacterium]|nr:Crp/Fnr family transcriptional regulator [Candidatus Daviesbacteria bacterium]
MLYKKHQIILRPEDVPPGVLYLHKGFVRYYSISESGQELTLIIFKPGDFFPVMTAINDTPTYRYFEAMTDVEIGKVSKEDFIQFLRSHSEVEFEVLNNILTRLDGLLERVDYLVFGNAYQKIASIFAICAERFGVKKGNSVLIKLGLTHRDIACLVGLTRETTSVEIKKLERADLIKRQGNFFVIKDLKNLEKVANWESSISSTQLAF